MTVLEHIVSSLQAAAAYNKHDSAPPSVILWTDGQRLWEPVASRIGECLERFYILNPDEVGPNSGPSTWIRYQLTADAEDGKQGIPVIYLPGISRQSFRSPIGFPEEAKHLYALQFLGQFWTQLNAKDWTPAALLSSADGGLRLDLAKDNGTVQALATQLASVLESPVSSFQGKRLEAADFNTLAVTDPAGMLLRWMCDPEKVKTEWPAERMIAFQEVCKQQFKFNPLAEGKIGAAEKLVAGGGGWEVVWARFEENPTTYRGVRDALSLVKGTDLFGTMSPRLPNTNDQAEKQLRQDLLALADNPHSEVLNTLIQLAHKHRERAASVWSDLGEAPLAQAVARLGRMAQTIQRGLPGTDWDGIAKAYSSEGWQVDAEARRSFAAVRNKADMDALTTALHAAYLPWLNQLALRVEPWARNYPNASTATARHLTTAPGTVHLFVDGLRADVALELSAQLEAAGETPTMEIAWSPLPSVTATAKPGWHPLCTLLNGEKLSERFEPQLAEEGKPLTTDGFRNRISKLGLKWFPGTETGDPSGCGWTETADFDARGHAEGAKLAWRISEELQVVRHRISELLQAGWKTVVVITDHGWLWLPGSLPKTELPTHLTASKWGRCAVPQPGAQHHLPSVPWFWANQHHVVLAPAVTAFRNGVEYAHGGMTLQETLTLTITVGKSHQSGMPEVAICATRWRGLRIQVELEGATSDCAIDIRFKAADAATSLQDTRSPKPLDGLSGKASIVISNDEHTGAAATLVILYQDEVVAKCPVTIGEN
jgi:hypothetical protein